MSPSDLSELKIDRRPPSIRRRGLRRPWLVVAGAVVIAMAGMLAWIRNRPLAVETAVVSTAYPYQAVTVLTASGYVVAQRKAAVSSKATGRLEWLGVSEGSVVKEDEVIARLESRDVRAAADQAHANIGVARAGKGQAEAELRDAQAAYGRARSMLERNFVSPAAVDTARARFDKAQAALGSARAALSAAQASARAAEVAVEQTRIRAPFDGVVLTKSANVGDVVTAFSSALEAKGAVVTVADMSTLEVGADVSESNLRKVSVGLPCEIQLDAFPDLRFRGRVDRLVPTVDRAKATVLTKVSILDHDADGGVRILPEMSAKVAFLSREVAADQRTPHTVLNPDAVVIRDGKSVVFVVVDDSVRRIPIRTEGQMGDMVVVTGVTAGERVVLRPDEALRDGSAVKLARK